MVLPPRSAATIKEALCGTIEIDQCERWWRQARDRSLHIILTRQPKAAASREVVRLAMVTAVPGMAPKYPFRLKYCRKDTRSLGNHSQFKSLKDSSRRGPIKVIAAKRHDAQPVGTNAWEIGNFEQQEVYDRPSLMVEERATATDFRSQMRNAHTQTS